MSPKAPEEKAKARKSMQWSAAEELWCTEAEREREAWGEALEGEAETRACGELISCNNMQVRQVNVKELESTFLGAALSCSFSQTTQVQADTHFATVAYLSEAIFYFICLKQLQHIPRPSSSCWHALSALTPFFILLHFRLDAEILFNYLASDVESPEIAPMQIFWDLLFGISWKPFEGVIRDEPYLFLEGHGTVVFLCCQEHEPSTHCPGLVKYRPYYCRFASARGTHITRR